MTSLHPPRPCSDPVVRVENLRKVFGGRSNQVVALDDVTIGLQKGAFTAIMGPSGSGKSTFMHCVAGLDSVTSGTISINGRVISGLSERRLTKFRRDNIGFVFQSFNLIPTLTAAENIRLPQDIAHRKIDEDLYKRIVTSLDLQHRLKHKPSQLSGGQQQRVACARALLARPAVLFADEPTGNLDSRSSAQVLQYLRQCVDQFNQTVVMVTHEPEAAAYADTVLFLKDGRIIGQLDSPTRTAVLGALQSLDKPAEPTTPQVSAAPQPPSEIIVTQASVPEPAQPTTTPGSDKGSIAEGDLPEPAQPTTTPGPDKTSIAEGDLPEPTLPQDADPACDRGEPEAQTPHEQAKNTAECDGGDVHGGAVGAGFDSGALPQPNPTPRVATHPTHGRHRMANDTTFSR